MTRFGFQKGMSQRERRVWGVHARRFMLDQLNLPTLVVSGRVLAYRCELFMFLPAMDLPGARKVMAKPSAEVRE